MSVVRLYVIFVVNFFVHINFVFVFVFVYTRDCYQAAPVVGLCWQSRSGPRPADDCMSSLL